MLVPARCMARLLSLAKCALLAFALIPCGCGAEGVSGHSQAANPSTASEPALFRFDVGCVWAGEVVSHAFRVKNPLAEQVSIKEDRDIRLNCGCTAVKPTARSLAPDEHTDVTVTVQTSALSGPFEYGGHLVWTSVGGKRITTTFALRGSVMPVLRCDPERLLFEADEIREGVRKELRFTENMPLDWSTLTVTGPGGGIEITDLVTSDHGASCRIMCLLSEEGDGWSGHILVRAQPRGVTAGTQREVPVVLIPVTARSEPGVVVRPRILPVRFDQTDAKATARLLLRGEKLAEPGQIVEGVICDGYDVAWQLNRTTNTKTAVLDIALTPLNRVRAAREEALLISFSGGKSIRIPMVRVAAGQETDGSK